VAIRLPDGYATHDPAIGEGSVWVAMRDAGAVVQVDQDSKEIVRTIDVGLHPAAMEFYDGHLWVSTFEDLGSIVRIDPRTGEVVDRFPALGQHDAMVEGYAMSAVGDTVWMSSFDHGRVLRIDGPSRAGHRVDGGSRADRHRGR
jgi:streptogramin lyase